MSYIEYVRSEPQSVSLLPVLAEANGFTMADLEANRGGRISDRQMVDLFRKAAGPLLYSGGVLIGWLLVVYVLYHFSPGFLMRRSGFSRWMGPMIVVTLSTAGAFVVAMLGSTRRFVLLLGDCSRGNAAFAEGRVAPSSEEHEELGTAQFQRKLAREWGGSAGPVSTVSRYHYVLKGEYFEVGPKAHTVLEPRMNYRLYFAPASRLLLSIEPVTTAV